MPRVHEMIEEAPPPRGSGAGECHETFLSMSPEEQEFLRGIATNVRRTLWQFGEHEAAAWLAKQLLDSDETVALYSLLSSDVRSALKRGAVK